jgi:hypothetical protein
VPAATSSHIWRVVAKAMPAAAINDAPTINILRRPTRSAWVVM